MVPIDVHPGQFLMTQHQPAFVTGSLFAYDRLVVEIARRAEIALAGIDAPQGIEDRPRQEMAAPQPLQSLMKNEDGALSRSVAAWCRRRTPRVASRSGPGEPLMNVTLADGSGGRHNGDWVTCLVADVM